MKENNGKAPEATAVKNGKEEADFKGKSISRQGEEGQRSHVNENLEKTDRTNKTSADQKNKGQAMGQELKIRGHDLQA